MLTTISKSVKQFQEHMITIKEKNQWRTEKKCNALASHSVIYFLLKNTREEKDGIFISMMPNKYILVRMYLLM